MRHATVRPTLLLATALGVAAMAPQLSAQGIDDLQDGRWLPFLGCWVEAGVEAGPMTCIVPDEAGVAFLTVTDGTVTEQRTVAADGVERPTTVPGCTGVETAAFSMDGHRVFTRAVLSCGVDSERETTGLMAMVGPWQWIQVRALSPAEGGAAWSQRYWSAPDERVAAAGLADRVPSGRTDQAIQAARIAAAGSISVEEIIEAHGRIATEAVRTWIAEHGDPIERLDADRLVRLAEAGVAESVIDVAVAVSFPDQFELAREPGEDRDGRNGRVALGVWPGYGTFGYFDRYYYDRYFYDRYPYGGYYPHYFPRRPISGTGVIVVRPTQRGRLVKGQGYTSDGEAKGTARPRSSSGSLFGSPRPGSSRGATVSTGSRSGSGSKGKAKPREGGG